MKKYDICIIGGGAAGCIAAICAKRMNKRASVCILEKNRDILRKVAASGNGRCNISNSRTKYSREIQDFFASVGVFFAEEDEGRLYPYNRSSQAVIDALKIQLEKNNVDIFTKAEVSSVEKGFTVRSSAGDISAGAVLIASGGKSSPEFGTTGDGFRFARELGHTVSALRPSLTAIDCIGPFEKLKGLRAIADVTLKKDGRAIVTEHGEVQFTETGFSGICIFNLSGYLKLEDGESFDEGMSRYSISVNFVPDLDDEQLASVLAAGGKISLLKKPMIDLISDDEISDWNVQVRGAKGWKKSQVTAGGVVLSEIDLSVMESSIVKNLYFAGEVIDYDGPCGGYNLASAWITGIRAGKAMAGNVQSESV